ncbi:hypothetical protein IAR55_003182 [Kwoniella newhampshirensis]|uniref:Protein HRI1 n=1 Tax=Kwoniella newhampshirensis TaxID=1651941 RepID=A0AAW0Z0N4_9TREE
MAAPAAAARASTRISITWSDAPPIEDTDTLVLTIDGYSLDMRVFVSGPGKGEIDWSTVARVDELEGSTAANPSLRWTHLIDSRPPSSLPDQGTFTTLPNGDVVEEGIMFNPKSSENEPYQEVWRRLKQEPNAPYLVLEQIIDSHSDVSLRGEEEGGEEVEAEEEGVFLGRVGENALGIAKLKSESEHKFIAWRDRSEQGAWNRIYEFGEKELVGQILPSLPAEIPSDWVKGETVDFGGKKWIVRTVGVL